MCFNFDIPLIINNSPAAIDINLQAERKACQLSYKSRLLLEPLENPRAATILERGR
jgi:hypothetical protein